MRRHNSIVAPKALNNDFIVANTQKKQSSTKGILQERKKNNKVSAEQLLHSRRDNKTTNVTKQRKLARVHNINNMQINSYMSGHNKLQ